jgi:hypothetical protein
MSFGSTFQKTRCYKNITKSENLAPNFDAYNVSTGSSLRYRSSDNNKEVYDSTAPRGGVSREVPVTRVRVPGKALKAAPHRAYGGSIVFRLKAPRGEYPDLDIQGMRRFTIVHLKQAGLTWRPIGKIVGMHHTTAMRIYKRMPQAVRVSLWMSELVSVSHINSKGKRTCLALRREQGSAWERTPARTKGRKSGAKPGSRRL